MRYALLTWSLMLSGCVRILDGGDTFDTDALVPSDTSDGSSGPGFVVTPAGSWPWALPEGFPLPRVPADNPVTVDKAELGRWLFHDVRLSGNGTMSCAGCHTQSLGFADPRGTALSEGSTGALTTRNAPGLQNVGFFSRYNWARPELDSLEVQHAGPLFGTDPVELGAAGREDEILARLAGDPEHVARFSLAFPDDADPFTWTRVQQALATFMRAMTHADAPVDRFVYGKDDNALSDAQLRGMDLFFSERLECHHCHGSFHFSRAVTWQGAGVDEIAYDNIGLYNIGGAYPERDEGLAEATGEPRDSGRFRPPSLRNVALSAPYMHDGSLATLDEVLDHYAAGGTVTEEGPNAGDGRLNPNKSGFLHGFVLEAGDRADLLAFLDALTDTTFLSDPRFSDPFLASEADTDAGDDTDSP